MFTGIIEATGRVVRTEKSGTSLELWMKSGLTHELKIDQSFSHNGVCLTVVEIKEDQYRVTAIEETLQKTNLSQLKVGDEVNLERAMQSGARFDGHMVQGHVDQTAVCTTIEDRQGSWLYTFKYDEGQGNITVEKGSICVNGISLTVVNSGDNNFSVAIIPYTYNHTNLKSVSIGDLVNLEFDILGKYVSRLLPGYTSKR